MEEKRESIPFHKRLCEQCEHFAEDSCGRIAWCQAPVPEAFQVLLGSREEAAVAWRGDKYERWVFIVSAPRCALYSARREWVENEQREKSNREGE